MWAKALAAITQGAIGRGAAEVAGSGVQVRLAYVGGPARALYDQTGMHELLVNMPRVPVVGEAVRWAPDAEREVAAIVHAVVWLVGEHSGSAEAYVVVGPATPVTGRQLAA